MEVMSGYKRTDVGVIPEDWEVRPVGKMGDVRAGKALAAKGEGQQRPYLRTKNVFDGQIVLNDVLRMPMTDADFSRYRLRHGDVLLNEGQSLELVGRCAMYKDEYPEPCAIQNQLVRFRARDGVSASFATHLFRHCQKSGVFAKIALQTTSVAHLGVSRFHRLQLAWPSEVVEQEAIAEALSDADTLIESLEQLLAKKRQLKQGAMQELLTGKRRLPGLGRGWANVRLRDLLSYERPDMYIVRDTEYSERGDTPVLTANKSFVLGYTAETSGICSDLPAIVFDDFTTASKYVDFPFKVKSSALKLLRPKHDHVNLRFVYDRMQLIRFPLGDHKRYYISEFQNLELAIPDHAEQLAIAETLSDMDAEVAALEARLAKARQLKQGMMQELLTGRIRLV